MKTDGERRDTFCALACRLMLFNLCHTLYLEVNKTEENCRQGMVGCTLSGVVIYVNKYIFQCFKADLGFC